MTNQQQKQPPPQPQQQQPVPRAAAVTPASTQPVAAATRGPSPRPPVPGASNAPMGGYPRPPAPPSSSAAAAAGSAAAARPASESSTRCAVCSQALVMSNRRVCGECRRDVCSQCSTSSTPADVCILTYYVYRRLGLLSLTSLLSLFAHHRPSLPHRSSQKCLGTCTAKLLQGKCSWPTAGKCFESIPKIDYSATSHKIQRVTKMD